MKNKKGFSLVEILAVIVILGIIAGIATAAYNYTKYLVLEEAYDNLIILIETKAESYASDNYSTLINVQTLIENGYLDSDDGYIYSPVDNEILNCYYIEITNVNGVYEAEFKTDMGSVDGVCNSFENEENFSIMVTDLNKEIATAYIVDDNLWYNQSVCLSVITSDTLSYKEGSLEYIWSNKAGGEASYEDNVCIEVENNTYSVEHNVVINYLGVKSATEYNDFATVVTLKKTVNIDTQSPEIIVSIEDENEIASKKTVNVIITDNDGSGVESITVMDDNGSEYTIINGQITVTENGTYTVTVTDNVGNKSTQKFTIENIYTAQGTTNKDYTSGEEVSYLDLDWLVVSQTDEYVTLILKNNYTTGKYGDSTMWETSSAKDIVNIDFLESYPNVQKEILAGVIIYNEESASYVRLITESEVSSSVSNGSGTPFWTMTNSGSYMIVPLSDGSLIYTGATSTTKTLYQGISFENSTTSFSVKVCSFTSVTSELAPTSTSVSLTTASSTTQSYYSSKSKSFNQVTNSYTYCSSSGKTTTGWAGLTTPSGADPDYCSLYTTCSTSSKIYSVGIRPVITVKKI